MTQLVPQPVDLLGLVQHHLGQDLRSAVPVARTRYRNELAALDRALTRWEPTDQVKAERSSRNGVVLACSCRPPRKIRMRGNPENIDITRIRCEICGKLFVPAS
jgi:hypothetical protein